MMNNICVKTDSYKFSHWKQYPPNTRNIYSYFESRQGAQFPYTTFFGLQYILLKHLVGQVVTPEKIFMGERRVDASMGKGTFNYKGWWHIWEKHRGHLPILIKAVPEGTSWNTGNVLMTVVNTDPECYWLVNYLETLLTQVWYPSTVCTQSRVMKKTILDYLNATGDPSLIDFKLHDFGYRGVGCDEQAAIGGAAHLVNFKGTDTFIANELLADYYGCDHPDIAGFSIPASEHSTITSWCGERGVYGEFYAFQNMLRQYPTGMVACVSDSYDLERACLTYWGDKLKDEVLARDGCLVVRPDSGEPHHSVLKVLNCLWAAFGGTVNEKGYRVLNPKVRVIQGDGIDKVTLERILVFMKGSKYSADNVAFGSGGGLLQKLNRDTQRFAFKCSAINVGSEHNNNTAWLDVYKRPATDPTKSSKRGRLRLVVHPISGRQITCAAHEYPEQEDQLRTVFRNGELVVRDDLAAIRKRAELYTPVFEMAN